MDRAKDKNKKGCVVIIENFPQREVRISPSNDLFLTGLELERESRGAEATTTARYGRSIGGLSVSILLSLLFASRKG